MSIYRPYEATRMAQKHLTDVGGSITFVYGKPMFAFPDEIALQRYTKLNREGWLLNHEQSNA